MNLLLLIPALIVFLSSALSFSPSGLTQDSPLLTIAEQPREKIISAKTAYEKAKAGEIVLIDIRRPSEWKETGIGEVAHPLTMHQPSDKFFESLADLTKNDRSKPIALICAVGGRSAYMQKILTGAGYSNVISVSEGMLGSQYGSGWINSNLPIRRLGGTP